MDAFGEKQKVSKDFRLIDLYIRLSEGGVVRKHEEAVHFGVDERTIQRDIDNIRAYLHETYMNQGVYQEIKYDRPSKGYILVGSRISAMTNAEILAVSKILLESRAFTKNDLNSILDKLSAGCAPRESEKLIYRIIANEKFHYIELQNKANIQNQIWDISLDIFEHNLVSIEYFRAVNKPEVVKRIIEPISILFSEFYFYLNAFIVIKNDKDEYVHKYSFPAIFRIDRIKQYKRIGKRFDVMYATRFQEGEFRKKVQFMFAGKLNRIEFKYYGHTPEHILDRMPTAKVLKHSDKEYLIEAEVYGEGILMWLLGQGSSIEVLKPLSLRNKIKDILRKMTDLYT